MSCDPLVMLGMIHAVAGAYAIALFGGWFLVTLFAQFTANGAALFLLRRCRTWRRFDRAMRKVMT